RALIRMRGYRYRLGDGTAPDGRQAERVDACWSVAQGLAMVDSFLAAGFHARHLLLAFDLGDARRISRALAVEAGYLGLGGRPAARKAATVLREARNLAEHSGD